MKQHKVIDFNRFAFISMVSLQNFVGDRVSWLRARAYLNSKKANTIRSCFFFCCLLHIWFESIENIWFECLLVAISMFMKRRQENVAKAFFVYSHATTVNAETACTVSFIICGSFKCERVLCISESHAPYATHHKQHIHLELVSINFGLMTGVMWTQRSKRWWRRSVEQIQHKIRPE